MKIGTLVSQYPAPSHTFIRREVAALRHGGLEVETFSIRPGQALSAEDRAELARTFTVLPGSPFVLLGSALAALRHPARCVRAVRAMLRHSLPGLANRLRGLVYLAEGLRLAAELERRGVTHVHSHFANPAATAGLVASRFLGITWSVTIHGATADFAGPMTPLLGRRVEDAVFVATVTEFGRRRLGQLVGGPVDKAHVVRCGVDLERLPRPTRSPPRDGEPLELINVARLSPEKGHLGLVEAFADLLQRGANCRLVIIGGGPEEAAIRAAIAARGLEGRVELRGALPESAVLEAMARAHVLVLSSRVEGLPVVLMEALGLELPVIAPAISGIPELVVDGQTGLLFPDGDWRALATQLERLVSDAPLRGQLAAAGRQRVLREFDARIAAAPLARLLRAAHAKGTTPTSDLGSASRAEDRKLA